MTPFEYEIDNTVFMKSFPTCMGLWLPDSASMFAPGIDYYKDVVCLDEMPSITSKEHKDFMGAWTLFLRSIVIGMANVQASLLSSEADIDFGKSRLAFLFSPRVVFPLHAKGTVELSALKESCAVMDNVIADYKYVYQVEDVTKISFEAGLMEFMSNFKVTMDEDSAWSLSLLYSFAAPTIYREQWICLNKDNSMVDVCGETFIEGMSSKHDAVFRSDVSIWAKGDGGMLKGKCQFSDDGSPLLDEFKVKTSYKLDSKAESQAVMKAIKIVFDDVEFPGLDEEEGGMRGDSKYCFLS